MKVDCLIIFPLLEEFNTVRQLIGEYELKDDLTWTTLFDGKGNTLKCVLTYVGEMNSLNTYSRTNSLLNRILPHMVCVIGLAGRLSSDIRLSDVVGLTLINRVQFEGKESTQGDGDSNDIYNLKSTYDAYKSFSIHNCYKSWHKHTHESVKEFIYKYIDNTEQLIKDEFIRADLTIKFFFGKGAETTYVVDSPEANLELRERDRKFLTVDNESAGFARACEEHGISQLHILRGVSDFANGTKEKIDSDNKGLFRKLALSNCFSFLTDVILQLTSFKDINESDSTIIPHKIDRIDKYIHTNGKSAFSVYNSVLRHIITSESINRYVKGELYKNLRSLLMLSSSEHPLVIDGEPGTGKSTIMYTLHKYLQMNNVKSLYIDLHRFFKIRSFAARENASKDQLEKIARSGGNYNCILVDGLDRFERYKVNELKQLYNRTIEVISALDTHVAYAITTQNFESYIDEINLFSITNPIALIHTAEFELSSFNVIKDTIRNVIKINGIHDENYLERVLSILLRSGIKRLDWFSINLIVKKFCTLPFQNSNSVCSVLSKFCKYYIETKHVASSSSDIEGLFQGASELAFRRYIRRDKIHFNEYNDTQFRMSHFSTSFKDFLIARYTLEQYAQISTLFKNRADDFNYVYTYGINVYFKDLLGRLSLPKQNALFKSLVAVYNDLDLPAKPNVCYIMGRFTHRTLVNDAKNFLVTALNKEKELKYSSDQYRQLLLLFRTIYISLAYLGDDSVAADYLEQIIVNEDWDDLNRGFHIEYYGDKIFNPDEIGRHEDDVNIDFLMTFSRINSKMNKYVSNVSWKRALFEIELYTLVSLALNRKAKGKLSPESSQNMMNLLKTIQSSNGIIMNNKLKSKVRLLDYFMQFKIDTILDTIGLFNNLKTEKRKGWSSPRVIKDREYKRVIANPESVADHTYGCLILALLVLPETIPGEDNYSKGAILQTLLLHDLGENISGDKPSFLKTDDDINQEYEDAMMLLSLPAYNTFAPLEEYKKLYNEFHTEMTINAKIAHDIDLIESYIQLHRYHSNEENVIEDFEQWASQIQQNIKTVIGKRILNRFSQM